MTKVSSGVKTSLMATGLQYNCVNNKMLESDWFLTALNYCLIWLMQHQNCPIGPVQLHVEAACNRTVKLPMEIKQ